MRHLSLAPFSLLIILAIAAVSSGQSSSPASPAATSSEEGSKPLYDLARVNGLDNYTGPEEGKALLASRGLLISPETNKQLFNFYNESPPYFITTDTALHIYRMILEKNFKQLERRQSGNLGRFLERAWKLLAEGRESDRARSQVQWPAAPRLRAATMAAVALRLLKPDWKPSGEAAEALYAKIAANVEAELKLIAAGSPSSSPLFGQTVDYSLLTPRGFYAGEEALERFFRARQFVATPLNLDDDGLLQVAAIWGVLCNDFNYKVHMTEPYRQLLGADNVPSVLTILDVFGRCGSGIIAMESDSKVRRIVEGRGLSEARQALRAALPPPLVPIGADLQQVMTEAQDDPERRPLRVAVWPQLAMPDAAMMSRCVWPHVPAARQPSGLDVLACVGNDRALSLLLSMTGEANRKPLERAVLDVRARRHRLFRPLVTRDCKPHDVWRDPLGEDETPGPLGWSEAANGAMWAGMEQVISALGKPAVTSRHPRFMATTAYADKSINTALAGWAGHRHTFVLHAPPMGICGCASAGTVTGYVEPNLPFWTAMDDLAMRTHVWLNKRGQRDNNMLALVELCKRARTIAEKQLAAVALSAEDNQWIKDYGTLMTGLCGYHPDIRDYDDECGFVVDIASDRQTDEVVYVGTGRPRAIYVIMDYGGRLQLARGGVLSYREFTRPLAEGRMTNAHWDELLSAGREPPAPDWLAKLGVDYTQQAERVNKLPLARRYAGQEEKETEDDALLKR